MASIANALVHAHHESSRSTPASYPETAYQLVLDILKVDTTWPTSRLARESRHLSVHNCLTVSTLVGVQKKLVSQRSTADILEPWMTHIRAFFAFPPGESEYHLTACELIAGILSVAFTWDLSDYQEAWHLLHPLLLNAFHALDQEKFLDFLDALHFAIDEAPLRLDHMLPSDYQKRPERSIPLQNLALHLEHYPDVVCSFLLNFSLIENASLHISKCCSFRLPSPPILLLCFSFQTLESRRWKIQNGLSLSLCFYSKHNITRCR